jgi:hypothetical protein
MHTINEFSPSIRSAICMALSAVIVVISLSAVSVAVHSALQHAVSTLS